MLNILLAKEWTSNIPKSLVTFLLGITILVIGIIWFAHKEKKERDKNISETESNRDYWFGIEDDINIWVLIIAGIVTIMYSFYLI